jgi:hypothetical protein
VHASQARHLVGPARLVGTPMEVAKAVPGYLFYLGPADGPEDATAPWAGFHLGPIRIAPAARGTMRVVLPFARLAAQGRELYLSSEENVMVLGVVVDGVVTPRPGHPVLVASADERRVFGMLARELFGAARTRSLLMALLQVLFAAVAAWSLSLVLAFLAEPLVGRLSGEGEVRLPAGGALPSITQMLRYDA